VTAARGTGHFDSLTSNNVRRRHDADGNPIVGVVEWRTRIFHSARLSRKAKYVGFVLSMFMRTDDGCAWASEETLAHYGRYANRKPVGEGLRELRRAGYLRSHRVSRVPEPGWRYIHYAALPGDRDPVVAPRHMANDRQF
jgi:hypothetical protein